MATHTKGQGLLGVRQGTEIKDERTCRERQNSNSHNGLDEIEDFIWNGSSVRVVNGDCGTRIARSRRKWCVRIMLIIIRWLLLQGYCHASDIQPKGLLHLHPSLIVIDHPGWCGRTSRRNHSSFKKIWTPQVSGMLLNMF